MDQEAYLAAFDQYSPEIFKYLYVRLNFAKEDAEDLLQDVFIKVWRHRDKYNKRKSSIRTWIYRIARNTLIDHLRRKKPETNQKLIDQASGNDDYQQIELILALKTLPEADYEVVVLKYIMGLTSKEISQATGINHSTVRVRIKRAIEKIKLNPNGQ